MELPQKSIMLGIVSWCLLEDEGFNKWIYFIFHVIYLTFIVLLDNMYI